MKRIVIVGGVAGGMSCATRLRRLDEQARITVLERGEHPSFANCGLPYHIGGEIAERGKLLVQTPEKLRANFDIDVRTQTEAVAIDRAAKRVTTRNVRTGEEEQLEYDALVLAPGAAPLRPPLPGLDLPGVFTLRNMADMDAINRWIIEKQVKRAVVVGGGYIGLEMAEQLHRRGIAVEVAEGAPQVMAPLDAELAALLHGTLRRHEIGLHLGRKLAAVHQHGHSLQVELEDASTLRAELVVMGLGVRPDVAIAREAGLELGALGGIRVDEQLRTSDPAIWAVGDAVEVRNRVTGEWALIPLAGPANRMGRTAADVICGLPGSYQGTWGTAVLRLFELMAACTGANERTLKRLGRPYEALHLHPGSHAGYFPGARPIALKVLFEPSTGKLLGAQAVGEDGVDKRIDVFATALAAGLTIDDIAELELAYAPPVGSAKDPVNLAGMAGQNVQRGLVAQAQWYEIENLDPATQLVVDVREAAERAGGALPNSVHIPLGQLRARLGELPRDKELIVHCASGQRSYNATRVLLQNGFRARNLAGSYRTWMAARGA